MHPHPAANTNYLDQQLIRLCWDKLGELCLSILLLHSILYIVCICTIDRNISTKLYTISIL